MKTLLLILALSTNCLGQVISSYGSNSKGHYRFKYPINKPVLADVILKEKPIITANDAYVLPKNTMLKLMEIEGEFYLATAGDKTGYVHYVYVDGDYQTFRARGYPFIETVEPVSVVAEPIKNATAWYGRVSQTCPVRELPSAMADSYFELPKNAIVKIRRHDINYWEVDLNGRVGYVGVYYILDYSRTENPFVSTRYTGPGDDSRDAPSGLSSIPTTGAPIYTGPRGGRYYINSHGNKTYIRRK